MVVWRMCGGVVWWWCVGGGRGVGGACGSGDKYSDN